VPFPLLPAVSDIVAHEGSFVERGTGRHLFLRGICFGPSAKEAPHLPFREPEDFERYETYLDLLLACGFTTLRLPIFWSALEPSCDPSSPRYDLAYADRYFEYVRKLTAKGFLVFIDLHQDLLGTQFGGNGLPTWVHQEGSKHGVILSGTPLWGLNYAMNRGLRKTFTAFWRNDLTNTQVEPALRHFKVRDRFVDAIEFIAERASHNSRVLGIEIFNEPHYATLAAQDFEKDVLSEFYDQATERIRRHSRDLFVFVSPQSDWNVNLRSDKDYRSHLPSPTDDRTVFAFHYYDSQLTALYGSLFHDNKREEYLDSIRLGVREAAAKGMVPFLTEFGTRQNWNTSVARRHMNWHFHAIEHAMLSATYWNVNLYNTQWQRDGFMREDFSLLGPPGPNGELTPRNLDIACRPYIVSSPVKPIVSEFSPATKRFEFVIEAEGVEEPVEIYLPVDRRHALQPTHYPSGFAIEYAGKSRYEFADNRLRIWLDPLRTNHVIAIVAT
jgi:aryl-phospho-beta-D-glucosidase BglC (GH1 family)